MTTDETEPRPVSYDAAEEQWPPQMERVVPESALLDVDEESRRSRAVIVVAVCLLVATAVMIPLAAYVSSMGSSASGRALTVNTNMDVKDDVLSVAGYIQSELTATGQYPQRIPVAVSPGASVQVCYLSDAPALGAYLVAGSHDATPDVWVFDSRTGDLDVAGSEVAAGCGFAGSGALVGPVLLGEGGAATAIAPDEGG